MQQYCRSQESTFLVMIKMNNIDGNVFLDIGLQSSKSSMPVFKIINDIANKVLEIFMILLYLINLDIYSRVLCVKNMGLILIILNEVKIKCQCKESVNLYLAFGDTSIFRTRMFIICSQQTPHYFQRYNSCFMKTNKRHCY